MNEDIIAEYFDQDFRTLYSDCNKDRCMRVMTQGRCHMRRGHTMNCDPFGESHLKDD